VILVSKAAPNQSCMYTIYRDVGDDVSCSVAKLVYAKLFSGDDETIHFDIIPYVLDEIAGKLRRRGYSAYDWASVIHVGA
jgi:hypothetical protein